MNNKYKFVYKGSTIHEFNSPKRMIPKEKQHIIVQNKNYTVLSVEEIIDFDNFIRTITICVI